MRIHCNTYIFIRMNYSRRENIIMHAHTYYPTEKQKYGIEVKTYKSS